MTSKMPKTGCIVLAMAGGFLFDGNLDSLLFDGSFTPAAEARIGRPATPLSYAGVARRTTRRVVRRSTIYVNTLPAGCAKVTVGGAWVWGCGGAYYQPYGGRYVVVYVD
jgi:hypothetical protein